jgi:hypothetical protein
MGEVEVVEDHRGVQVCPRADRDHPRALGGVQSGEQPGREPEVAEVVGGELELVPLAASPELRDGHDPGVVDQDVQGAGVLVDQPVDRGPVARRLHADAAGGAGDQDTTAVQVDAADDLLGGRGEVER